MRPIVLLLLVSQPLPLLATINGPSTSSTGNFNLTWDYTLREVDSAGSLLTYYSGNSETFFRLSGTYYFEEEYCFYSPYTGYMCAVSDTHQVHVSTSVPYPESSETQAQYDFQIRSGDFDANGRTDLYVERLTPGPVDGSMQSYFVWNNSNGTLSTAAATGSYVATAQSYAVNTTLNLMPTDVNADGYPDHFIERIDQVLGGQFEQEMAVYAPGTASNKLQPQGSSEWTDEVKQFESDIGFWSNNDDHFADNMAATQIPIFALGYSCLPSLWSTDIYGFYSGDICLPYLYQIGVQTVTTGISLDALTVSGHLDSLSYPVTDNDLWQISQVVFNVLGVHAFGFDSSGTRHTTNFTPTDEEEEQFKTLIEWWGRMAIETRGMGIVPKWHDWIEESFMCDTADSWCTLENVACWGRHYHAPLKQEGYGSPVQNGGESVLSGHGDDPIITGVGEGAELPEHAIGNITKDDQHIFHNPDAGQWGSCPTTVPNQGTGNPSQVCNQTYREPYVTPAGEIWMRTRGTGYNHHPVLNDVVGPWSFGHMDEKMRDAMENAPGHMCPSL